MEYRKTNPTDSMDPLTQQEIKGLFSKKERRDLIVPNLSQIRWENLDFLGWRHRSGHLAFIVYQFDGNYKGLTLTLVDVTNRSATKMCSWCHTLHPGQGVTMFGAKTIANSRMLVANTACSDLQCSQYVRGLLKPDATQLQETIGAEEKILRLRRNLDLFFQEVYGS